MVVNRAHFEKALAVGELEVGHLQHNRAHLAEVNDTERQKQNRHIDRERESADDSAEEERACVAHKDLRGVEVPHKEAEAAARDRRRHKGHAHIADKARNEHKEQSDEEGYRGVETVDTVGEVYGVYNADNHDRGDHIVEPAEVKLADKGDDRLCAVAHKAENGKIGYSYGKLEHQLLNRGESEVALFDNLYKIIHEADRAVTERQSESREHEGDHF